LLCGIGVAVGLLLTGVPLALGQSTPQPAQDGLLKNGPPVWDANRDGVFTCDEWKSFADRLFSSADRNRDGKLDPSEFATVQKADATLADADCTVYSKTTVHGLVAVNIGSGSAKAVEIKTRRAKAVLEEVSLTFQRLDIEKAMEDARLHLQAQLLRDAFHGTLSHELCTPLAAIRGSASVLDSMPLIREHGRVLSLVDAISDEAADLDDFIRNLLNATRVTEGGVSPRFEWTDPRDIVTAALKRRARRLAAHRIETEFADDLPLVNVDSGLIEEAYGQLLENAAKYSPSGSTISIRGRDELGRAVLSISDQGVGITPDEHQQLGRKSFRSRRHQATIPGSGLGFWIASTFVKANGGTIDIFSRGQGQGTTASIVLPGAPIISSELTAARDE
jgi:two-component system sensor histidine kinase KdpD